MSRDLEWTLEMIKAPTVRADREDYIGVWMKKMEFKPVYSKHLDKETEEYYYRRGWGVGPLGYKNLAKTQWVRDSQREAQIQQCWALIVQRQWRRRKGMNFVWPLTIDYGGWRFIGVSEKKDKFADTILREVSKRAWLKRFQQNPTLNDRVCICGDRLCPKLSEILQSQIRQHTWPTAAPNPGDGPCLVGVEDWFIREEMRRAAITIQNAWRRRDAKMAIEAAKKRLYASPHVLAHGTRVLKAYDGTIYAKIWDSDGPEEEVGKWDKTTNTLTKRTEAAGRSRFLQADGSKVLKSDDGTLSSRNVVGRRLLLLGSVPLPYAIYHILEAVNI